MAVGRGEHSVTFPGLARLCNPSRAGVRITRVPKNLLSSASTFAKNIGLHARRIVQRDETLGEAWAEITLDMKKFRHAVAKVSKTTEEKESDEFLEAGRRAYNAKDLEKAEKFFRQALIANKNNCMAHTYLGYVMYRVGRLTEAEACWLRALDVATSLQAGEKARQKLLMLQKKKSKVVNELEERLREGK